MTPTEARAAFLWSLTTPEQVMAAATTPELQRAAAERLGVSLRTVQRHANAFVPCPGPRCMTNVRGGGLCSFCRRTP
jgi:hypothetical protein